MNARGYAAYQQRSLCYFPQDTPSVKLLNVDSTYYPSFYFKEHANVVGPYHTREQYGQM